MTVADIREERRRDRMIVTLITPTPADISAFGIRALSAYLKQAGHVVKVVFLPGGIERLRHGGDFQYTYSRTVLDQISDIASTSDIIGLSFMSQYRDRAIQITQHLRSTTQSRIVWGGIHTEVNPRDALEHADAACIGEGERVLPGLIDAMQSKRSIANIPGLWVRDGERIIDNGCPDLIQDLDSLPFVDMGPDDHYFLDPRTERIMPMTTEALSRILPLMPARGGGAITVFRMMTSRGCPHRCTYCANRIMADRHQTEKYLRFRSPDHVMGEIHQVIAAFPFIRAVHFFDDVFTAMPFESLRALCTRYASEIGLPFYAQASPKTLTRDHLRLMLDSGLVFLEMGLQTGSPRIQKMYQRAESIEEILEGTRLLHAHQPPLLTPHYHVILDNPWETRDDVRATLDLCTRIPGKFMLCLASLTFYPGTDLNIRAQQEGLLSDDDADIYRKPFYIPKGRYLNYLIYLTDIAWIPRGLLRWMGGWPAELLDRPMFGGVFDLARRVTDRLRLIGKGITALGRGEFGRITRYFRRIT